MTPISPDYLIIGAGTAGSVLASRLTENPHVTVTLLEAGSDGPSELASDPSAWRNLAGSKLDWGYETTPQSHAQDRTIPYPRGKAVGGSSMINAMMQVWPEQGDFDAWPADALASWTYDALLPFLLRSETATRSDGAPVKGRGASGVFRVREEAPHDLSDAAISAFATLRHTWTGRFPLAILGGKRETVADAYLTPAVRERPNLTIIPGATVTRLLFDQERHCTGAQYDHDSADHTISATREVILSAGVIGTPHLLQVSGIGDASMLNDLGIPVIADSPEVGRNLQDHPLLTMIYPATTPLPSTPQHVEAGALIFSDTKQTRPDLQLFVMNDVTPDGTSALCISISVVTPNSRGSVRAVSANIAVAPQIDVSLLGDSDDLARLRAGVRLVRTLATQPALAPYTSFEAVPGAGIETDSELDAYLREAVGPYWHGVGTARMGDDKGSVVDPHLVVRGVTGLCIVDASVMPTIPSANTNATVLAIAERTAQTMGK